MAEEANKVQAKHKVTGQVVTISPEGAQFLNNQYDIVDGEGTVTQSSTKKKDAEDAEEDNIEELRRQYEEVFGEAPNSRKKAATLQKEIEEKQNG
jgi:protein subunit release factor B